MSGRNGYIKLHRKILDWGWYLDSNAKLLFIHLLLIANFKESKFEDIIVYPGQVITSIKSLSQGTGLTPKQVRTSLEKLEKTQNVAKKGANRYTLITIENWGLYQDDETKRANSWANEGQTEGKRRANEGQHHKNAKNAKNEKNSVCVNNKYNNYIYKGDAKKIGEREHTHPYGEFQNVFLTSEEYERLCQRFTQVKKLIDKVSIWLTEHDRKNHFAVCLKFAKSDDWPKVPKIDKAQHEESKGVPMPEYMRKKYRVKQEEL